MNIRTYALTALLVSSLPMAAHAAPETYNLDPNHTNISWHVDHFGFSSPSGRFGIKEGTLVLDEANPAASNLNVTIDVTGLVTGIPKFDEHIKSADFLDAAKYPTAIFKSTKVERSGNEAKVTGNLTLHGVTKPIVLDVELNKIGEHPMTKVKSVGFSAETKIKRSDFGVNMYVPNVGDEVDIKIETEAGLAGAAKPAK